MRGPERFCSLSRFTESIEPLLEPEISCISSTITYFTSLNLCLNLGDVRTRESDSGVVMNMCGGLLAMRCLSLWLVSPDLIAVLIFGRSMPSAFASS